MLCVPTFSLWQQPLLPLPPCFPPSLSALCLTRFLLPVSLRMVRHTAEPQNITLLLRFSPSCLETSVSSLTRRDKFISLLLLLTFVISLYSFPTYAGLLLWMHQATVAAVLTHMQTCRSDHFVHQLKKYNWPLVKSIWTSEGNFAIPTSTFGGQRPKSVYFAPIPLLLFILLEVSMKDVSP